MAARGSNAWRLEEWGPPCTVPLVVIPIYAGGPRLQVHRTAAPAFLQLGQVFLRHGYVIRRAGGFNCRRITGGRVYSSHAWGISGDFNDDTNPYRTDRLVTDMPRALIEDIEAIVTRDGVQVFRSGADWDGRPETPHSNYDAMHKEIIATPAELAAGFDVLPPTAAHGASALAYPVVRRGARGPLVVQLQQLLGLVVTTGNGTFGPRTEMAVKIYQAERGLEPDGIVGAATWTALLTNMPPLPAGAPRPQKPF
jgi:hypothetical protein